jgi:hypothetical protein
MTAQRWGTLVLVCFMAWLAWPGSAVAHVGAPYPVLLEEPVGPYSVSAMADPDVGRGTFFVMVETVVGEIAPADSLVTLWVRPEDGHLAESAYRAERQQTRYGERFVVEVPFDAKGAWQVRLVIEGTNGRGETAFPVQVTAAGLGWSVTLGCLVPFAILGLLWLRGVRRQRAAR